MAAQELRDEVVALAQELIRIDTSNPPGNETRAAEVIVAYLAEAGVDCELVGPDPDRLNVVARVPGMGDGPSIMLLAHTDVVPAPTEGWTVPPFSATLVDGRLIGRGAVDMKNELAARVVAVAALARSGVRPAGDVVLIAEADEERNVSDVGLSWLARERPDLRCDLAINEGGGVLLELASGRRVITVSVGEKQVTSLRIRVFGRAGHASIPPLDDNALRHAATAVERLLAHTEPPTLVPSVAAALEAMGAPAGEPEEMIAWAASQHPVLGDDLPAVTRMTLTPTGLRTYEPPNVVPPFADVICDCRTLPRQTVDDIRNCVSRVLGDDFKYELELLEPLAGGTESPTDTPLFEALREYAEERANAELLPLLSAGFTDSHWIREAWGTVAYGFAPVLFGDLDAYLNAAHSTDEAIEVADLVEMAEFHRRLLTSPALATSQTSGPHR